jgi:hypothetical protein
VLANGRILDARRRGMEWRIDIPEGTPSVRLVSRIWSPLFMHPWATDGRPLGVAIARPRLDGRDVSLTGPLLTSGWHACEGYWRWTSGDAQIVTIGARELSFDVVMTGIYWRDDDGEWTASRQLSAG